ncbi:hypothetical protein [Streptomyces cyaneofuscatus]|uniref:hypothetical protein n=1 Tax=Streptomyces cyaneofuscatus TaxID=66883 RepID=UPI00365E5B8E
MNLLGLRTGPRLIAVGYIGLVTAAALAYEIAGRPESVETAMILADWPGGIILLLFVLYPLALLTGDTGGTEESGFSLLNPLFHGAGALVNVLMVWTVVTFARHFAAEWSRSH